MTNEEKQIEEMAQCLCEWNRGTLCILDDKDCDLQCTYGKLANRLTAKGYRKASDVARVIFAEIEENMTDIRMGFATLRAIGKRHLAKIKEKYESEDEENGN